MNRKCLPFDARFKLTLFPTQRQMMAFKSSPSNGLEQWFSTSSGPSPGKMIFLCFAPVTISFVANCHGVGVILKNT